MLFPASTLDAIEQAIGRAERAHAGEIRFADRDRARRRSHVISEVTPRARALEVFAHFRVWDTERNNGVLIYVQLADRDRGDRRGPGLCRRGSRQAEWEAVCRLMEAAFSRRALQGGLDRRGRCRRRRCWRGTFPAASSTPARQRFAQPIA